MRVATKLGLAELLEAEAAAHEARMGAAGGRWTHSFRTAAKALRMLTDDQEADLLEWQVGGAEGIGIESYDNPIKVIRPLVYKVERVDRYPAWMFWRWGQEKIVPVGPQ